jgi:hypothetical protein
MILPLILKLWLASKRGRTSPTSTMEFKALESPTTMIRVGRGGAAGSTGLSQPTNKTKNNTDDSLIFIMRTHSYFYCFIFRQ